MAARATLSDQPENQACRGDPLRPVALGRPLSLSRRRPHRNRQQHGGTRYPTAGPQSQERTIRWFGRRRRALGGDRFADRNLQAAWRRAARLPGRRYYPHRQRSPPDPKASRGAGARRAVNAAETDEAQTAARTANAQVGG